MPTDKELVETCDYILSIVPPRDAYSTAERITTALKSSSLQKPLFYLDLNAISPHTARTIETLFSSYASINFLDGGIIGGPPSKADAPSATNVSTNGSAPSSGWLRPSIPVSGSIKLSSTETGSRLVETLDIKHIADTVGPASGLKMCFATTTKGFTALCIQAFTTAQQLGVLPELQAEMAGRVPTLYAAAKKSVPSMCPKAYRWVKEMEEIGETHEKDGGFEAGLFKGVAGVYRDVEESILGEEKTERRKRGRDIDDVAEIMSQSLKKKRNVESSN